MRSIFGRHFRVLVGCGGVAAILLGAPVRSDATTLHLTDGGSSADVCVPGVCSTAGLQNWIINGVDQLIEQWFSFGIYPEGPQAPHSVEGTIDSISGATTGGHDNTAWVYYFNDAVSPSEGLGPAGIGIRIDYTLSDAAQTIYEDVTVTNPTYWTMGFGLSDGQGNEGSLYLLPYGSDTLHFEVSAVPEPMSMVLLGTGLVAVGRAARRRKQQAQTTA